MTPDVVVDIGNSRIKWGWIASDGEMDRVSLPSDPAEWNRHLVLLPSARPLSWAIASVHPERLQAFAAWVVDRGDQFGVVTHEQIPLTIKVDEPAKIGIDRLVTALAATRRTPGRTLVVASVGTAVTVDIVGPAGEFAGGSIFPGLRLMAEALHEHTATLPFVEVKEVARSLPGRNTVDAIRTGVFWAVVGGISFLATQGHQVFGHSWPKLYLTGGDSHLLKGFFNFDPEIVPTLTLDGIRIAAEALP